MQAFNLGTAVIRVEPLNEVRSRVIGFLFLFHARLEFIGPVFFRRYAVECCGTLFHSLEAEDTERQELESGLCWQPRSRNCAADIVPFKGFDEEGFRLAPCICTDQRPEDVSQRQHRCLKNGSTLRTKTTSEVESPRLSRPFPPSELLCRLDCHSDLDCHRNLDYHRDMDYHRYLTTIRTWTIIVTWTTAPTWTVPPTMTFAATANCRKARPANYSKARPAINVDIKYILNHLFSLVAYRTDAFGAYTRKYCKNSRLFVLLGGC
ncbi:hypothetical protein MTO96_010568 [Rhipicephalus appendiculatus]